MHSMGIVRDLCEPIDFFILDIRQLRMQPVAIVGEGDFDDSSAWWELLAYFPAPPDGESRREEFWPAYDYTVQGAPYCGYLIGSPPRHPDSDIHSRLEEEKKILVDFEMRIADVFGVPFCFEDDDWRCRWWQLEPYKPE